mmetsp:Transcript_9315/g.16049  ORF Transcript_9315/g.16049 Transcript_9315/m.16049 type:complete len:220 (-) Transcript_9315:813-1472(-)
MRVGVGVLHSEKQRRDVPEHALERLHETDGPAAARVNDRAPEPIPQRSLRCSKRRPFRHAHPGLEDVKERERDVSAEGGVVDKVLLQGGHDVVHVLVSRDPAGDAGLGVWDDSVGAGRDVGGVDANHIDRRLQPHLGEDMGVGVASKLHAGEQAALLPELVLVVLDAANVAQLLVRRLPDALREALHGYVAFLVMQRRDDAAQARGGVHDWPAETSAVG